MKNEKKTFLIVDGNALLHRAWHAIPPLTTSDGRVVNAAYGFIITVEKVREQFAPDYMAVAWDLPGGTFRHEAYKEYKGTREKKADELYEQIGLIQEILDLYHVPSLSVKGFEADDIIGTLAKKYGPKVSTKVLILTGDLDALQLVDKDVEVVTFVIGLSKTKIYDDAAVKERYGLVPDQLIDFKALMGDASDNIPGLKGVGKKTASDLLAEHGTIDGIFKAIANDEIAEKHAKKFRGQEKIIEEMRFLVTIVTDMDLDFRITDATVKDPDVPALVEMFRDLEFRNLLRKYQIENEDAEGVMSSKSIKGTKGTREKNPDESLVHIDELNKDICYVLLEEGEQNLFDEGSAVMYLGDGKQVVSTTDAAAVLAHVNVCKEVVGHDLKKLMHTIGLITSPLFDTMVAAYLLSPGSRHFALDEILYEQAGKALQGDEDARELVTYLPKLSKELRISLMDEGMMKLANEIEMPVIPVLYEMEKAGIALDSQQLEKMSKKLAGEIETLTQKIHMLAGREFNIKSPSQLADILFNDLSLPIKKIKKTKTGYSTAASELEKLSGTHDIIPFISTYRELTKLKSTYVDVLPTLVAEDGRIHTDYRQTVAATGRLSSKDPNLQNIPIRTELGREIRRAFVAEPGNVLVAADFSQIELRLAAVIATDEAFLSAFKDGADIHRRTAAEVLGKKEDDVTKDERSAAKAINFGILYGMGARNLAKSTGFSTDEAKGFIERYFELHPGVQSYIEKMKKKAVDDGYIETLFGRRRYLPDVNSGIPMLRAAAERMAVNMPLQGTQADLIKKAMIEVQAWIETSKLDVRMLLQVHDELVFEVKESDAKSVAKKVEEIMAGVAEYEVPLVVDVEVGKNWKEMEKVVT
jgi:DNA polymerase I